MGINKGISWLGQFLREEEGATAVEYAVMLALILGAVIGTVTVLATATQQNFQRSGDAIRNATGG